MKARRVLLPVLGVVLVGAGLTVAAVTFSGGATPAAPAGYEAPPGGGPAPEAAGPARAGGPAVTAPSTRRPPARAGTPPAASAPPGTEQARPAPFLQSFAGQPGVRALPRRPSPTAPLSMPAFADGCDHAYGDPNQCVPLVFPPGTANKCAWLAAHGFTAVPVVGEDRQGLDPDGDRRACHRR
jgi:hypothetical protein